MDNSKEYIKMCEKAEEIQEFKSEDENWVRGDYFSKSGTMHIKRSDPFELHKEYEYPVRIFLEDMYGNKIIDNDYIWLPRQDQLQGIVIDRYKAYPTNLVGMLLEFHFFTEETEQQDKFVSMEQLWLAFVMKEKYQKTWNGKEWEVTV